MVISVGTTGSSGDYMFEGDFSAIATGSGGGNTIVLLDDGSIVMNTRQILLSNNTNPLVTTGQNINFKLMLLKI